MMPTTPRPKRPPLWAGTRRRSDGAIVEVWATRHTLRSRDRQVDGSIYYRPLVFINGQIYDHMPRRFDSPDGAVAYVQNMLGGGGA